MRAPKSAGFERELVVRARAGDSQAVADLFTRFWRAVRASAYTAVGDISRAEDAASEAFRIALPALNKLRDPDRFAPWLRRIALRVARRQTLRTDRAAELRERAVHSGVPDPAQLLERRELALLVCQAVDELPPAEREAILLYYFEGYAGAAAAHFIGIPVGSLRRRLHDGRIRLRKRLTTLPGGQAREDPKYLQLQARVHALLSRDARPGQLYELMPDLVRSRPVPYRLLAALTAAVSGSVPKADFGHLASQLLIRPHGPLFADPGPVGEAARALRTALSDFQDWTIDSTSILQRFPNIFRWDEGGRTFSIDPELMPPGFSSGEPGRYLRVRRGLLFGGEGGAVVDPAELFLRSGSPAAFREGMRPAWVSDVLDVYWIDARPIELSDVEAWVIDLADRVVARGQSRCSVHVGPRYRTALRLSFAGDPRPAAIGGVLAAWPGAPEGVHAVHLCIYLEPWAQILSGHLVRTQPVPDG